LNRAPLVNLVLGGASIGLGAGTWTHIAKSFTEGEDVRPEGMVSCFIVVQGLMTRSGNYPLLEGMIRSNLLVSRARQLIHDTIYNYV